MKPLQILSLVLIYFSFAALSCDKDDNNPTGSFSYTVSGDTSASVSGSDTNFGTSNGELFIRLTDDTDELVIRILIDPTVEGSYDVNPVLVNNNPQPIVDGDAFADLGLGSVFTGGQESFSTDAGNGGTVTISSVSDNQLRGSFNFSMLRLVGGSPPFPEVNVQGTFTAVK